MTMLPTRLRVSMGRVDRSAGASKSKRLAVPLFAGVVVLAAFFARADAGEASATLYATLAIFGAMFIVMTLATLRWLHPRTVSILLRSGHVVFSPPSVPHVAIGVVTGLAWLAIVRLWAVPEQWAHLSYHERGGIVVGPLVGAYMIAETLWALRRPVGLTVDEKGLRGVRGGPRFDLVWVDVIDVKVSEAKKQRYLVLVRATGGGVELIPEGAVSGDVYAVATVVNYYLQNPGERVRLSDGLDAVRHVDAEVRARRFSAV